MQANSLNIQRMWPVFSIVANWSLCLPLGRTAKTKVSALVLAAIYLRGIGISASNRIMLTWDKDPHQQSLKVLSPRLPKGALCPIVSIGTKFSTRLRDHGCSGPVINYGAQDGRIGTQVIAVSASIHLIDQLNYVAKVVMWSNKQNGGDPRPLEFLPVSGYKRGSLK